jgi:hypothetical protein
MTSFAIHATEPTELDTLLVDNFGAQNCLQIPIKKDAIQTTTSLCGIGAIVYQHETDDIRAKLVVGWKPLATVGPGPGQGPEGAIQLSDGNGGLTFESNLTSTVSTNQYNPITRLVIDASNTPGSYEPNTRLYFDPPTGPVLALTAPPLDGDISYFDDSMLSGKDLYFYNGFNWVSLTGAGSPSTAAGPLYSVQVNATGGATPQLGGSADFLFDTSGASNALSLNADSTINGMLDVVSEETTGGSITMKARNTPNTNYTNVTINSGAFEVTNTSTINLWSNGNITETSASAGISLEATTAGQTITNKTGNIVTELKDGASGEFLTISSNYAGGSPPDFGIRLRADATYDQGAGASLYLEGTGSTLAARAATMELNTNNNLAGTPYPNGKLARVYHQTAGSSSFSGGYKVLYAAGSATSGNIPTPDDLNQGVGVPPTPLKYGEFYIGEARKSGRPHVNYNLSSGSGSQFSRFNLAESNLHITDHLETTSYVSLSKGADSGNVYGGNVSLYPTTGNIASTQIRGDGLATFGQQLGTSLIRLDGTATGNSAGGLITLENDSYQNLGTPLANPIKLDATGASPEIVIGTRGTGGPVPGALRITEGNNDSIIADGGPNGVSIFNGKLTVVGSTLPNSSTTLLGGKNTGAVGLRSIEADGSLLANGIGHISSGTWSNTSYDQRADLCLGGIPRVIPALGQPTATENDPDFMIRTNRRNDGTGAYTTPGYMLNRYKGPQVNFPPIGDSRSLFTTMALERFDLSPQTVKNRIQIAGGAFVLPTTGSASTNKYMLNLVSRVPTAPSNTLLPLGDVPGQAPPNTEQWPITNARDPDDGICLNGDIVINRRRGITIDADDYIGPSWGNSEGPLFIGNINNSGVTTGQKACTISTTYNLGVHIGSDYGLSYSSSNNTGCTINGDIRVGNVASMDIAHGRPTAHTGYIGDGGLFSWNKTGFRGSSIYTNIIGVSGTKAYIAENLSSAADNMAVIGSCVEGPQGVIMLRGQIELVGHNATFDIDSCTTTIANGTIIIPHNNPNAPWPPGTFAAMFQNPMVNVVNAGLRNGATVPPGDAAQGANIPFSPDGQFTAVQAQVNVDISQNPPVSTLAIQSQQQPGTPDLTVNYVIYCERKDAGYLPVLGGSPGFTKVYPNIYTGSAFTFSGTATADEINANGGESGFIL